VGGAALLLAPLVIGKIGLGLTWVFQSLLNLLAPLLISMAVLSFLLAPILGEKGSKALAELWGGLFRGIIALIGSVVRFALGLLKR